METLDNLHQRDKVGVDDFVLLENFEDKGAFLENLQKRYKENIIYVRNYFFIIWFFCNF